MKAFKLILVFCFFVYGVSSAAITLTPVVNPTIGIRKSSDSPDDTSRINSLTREGIKYISSPAKTEKAHAMALAKAKACIDSALLICGKKKIEIPALLHLLSAEHSLFSGDTRNAIEEASFAMKQAENSGESEAVAKTMIFFGNYYFRIGFFTESMDYFGKSIAYSKKNQLKNIIPMGYEGMSKVCRKVKDFKCYRQNLQLMIDAAIVENDSLYLAAGYTRLGSSLIEKPDRNFRQADSLLRRSLEISLIRKDTSGTAFAMANIGYNYYLERMYDSSLISYNKSLKFSIPANLYSASANSLGNIGTIYRDLKNPEKSIKYYTKAIDHGIKEDDWYNLQWIYADMSEMYLRLRDTSNAFKSFVLFKKYSDSYIIKENTQGLTDEKLRYDADTHNKEVQLLSLRLKNQRILNYGFIGFIIVALAFGLLILRGSRLKAKRRISEMNRKISEITQANLRQQMNPHFIFNTLNSIQYYMYQHDKLATNNYLTKFSNLMRKVLENSQHTSIPLHDELIALNLYLELESIRFKDKFSYEIKVDEDIDPIMYKVPTMLIQPYVENSICHGLMPREGKGFVKIDIKPGKDHLLCTIEDNGIGREAAKEKRMKSESNHNSLGTQITASRLDLVNALYGTSLSTIYTDLKNENSEPTGTRVEIHIPILT